MLLPLKSKWATAGFLTIISTLSLSLSPSFASVLVSLWENLPCSVGMKKCKEVVQEYCNFKTLAFTNQKSHFHQGHFTNGSCYMYEKCFYYFSFDFLPLLLLVLLSLQMCMKKWYTIAMLA